MTSIIATACQYWARAGAIEWRRCISPVTAILASAVNEIHMPLQIYRMHIKYVIWVAQ